MSLMLFYLLMKIINLFFFLNQNYLVKITLLIAKSGRVLHVVMKIFIFILKLIIFPHGFHQEVLI